MFTASGYSKYLTDSSMVKATTGVFRPGSAAATAAQPTIKQGLSILAIPASGFVVSKAASALDVYDRANANLTNEEMRNIAVEQYIVGSSNAMGAKYGMWSGLASGTATGIATHVMTKGRFGILGAAVGTVTGGAIGSSYGAFQEAGIRSAYKNDYLSNTGESDVSGARAPYRAPDYAAGALTTAGLVAGGLGGTMMASKYMGRLPKTGFAGLMAAPIRYAGANPNKIMAATTVAGMSLGLAMARQQNNVTPDNNRIRGLGY